MEEITKKLSAQRIEEYDHEDYYELETGAMLKTLEPGQDALDAEIFARFKNEHGEAYVVFSNDGSMDRDTLYIAGSETGWEPLKLRYVAQVDGGSFVMSKEEKAFLESLFLLVSPEDLPEGDINFHD